MKFEMESINLAINAKEMPPEVKAQFEVAATILTNALRIMATLELPIAIVANVLASETACAIAQMPDHERREKAIVATETHFRAMVRAHRAHLPTTGDVGHG